MLGLVAALLLAMGPCPASGCLCSPPRPVRDEVREAVAVFSGEAVFQEYMELTEGSPDYERLGGGALVTRFKAGQWWKGGAPEDVVVYTSASKSHDVVWTIAEDARFRVGERYLVYAYAAGDKLRTRVCTRTAELSRAEEDLRELGKGSEPVGSEGAGVKPTAQPNIGTPDREPA